jgi:hypothetical protein
MGTATFVAGDEIVSSKQLKHGATSLSDLPQTPGPYNAANSLRILVLFARPALVIPILTDSVVGQGVENSTWLSFGLCVCLRRRSQRRNFIKLKNGWIVP